MTRNLLLLTDSYKPTHWKQYPPDTTRVFSYFESRGGAREEVLFFGLQYWLQQYLSRGITQADIDEAAEICAAHFGNADVFNRAGWEHILRVHDGRLPVLVSAVPEGTIVPAHRPLMTVVNTDPAVPWLTNYLESLLVQVWYPCTVATQSWRMRTSIEELRQATGCVPSAPFGMHDFGFRGSTSPESAGIGGCAHLVAFRGSDTLPALIVARDVYREPMAGRSIPAAEHSTITSWGRDGETDAYRNMLRQYPTGWVAVVSDSFDVFHACREIWGDTLRTEVLGRDGGVVIRPDSGDPVAVIGNVLDILGQRFGTTMNAQGYRTLPPQVRVLQGDGVTASTIVDILEAMRRRGWAASNVSFGSGGALLQKVNRDTHKFAFKCSAVERGGRWHDVVKDPVTDPGKRSKGGLLGLTRTRDTEGGVTYTTVRRAAGDGVADVLRPVFCDGIVLADESLATIRERVDRGGW